LYSAVRSHWPCPSSVDAAQAPAASASVPISPPGKKAVLLRQRGAEIGDDHATAGRELGDIRPIMRRKPWRPKAALTRST
jgi:hypothetical protein